MARKSIILIGAKTDATEVEHYGGVLTFSNGIVDYAYKAGVDVKVVNTLRPGFAHLGIFDRICRGLKRTATLIRLLSIQRIEGVVILSGTGGSFYERVIQAAVCRVFRVPSVLCLVSGHFFSIESATSFKRWLVSRLLRVPNRLVASGSKWALLFHKLNLESHRIEIVHSWIPPSPTLQIPKFVQPDAPIRFVYVGWMIEEKGIREVLSALEQIVDDYDCQFTFLGAGALLNTVQDRIRTAGWSARVSADGWATPTKVNQVLAESHVFVLPSYAEGFPTSLIEALSHGLPSICTDVGGISDSLDDGINGFLIPPKDPVALRKAMEFYLQHPERVAQHSIASLKIFQKNHDPDINCALLLRCVCQSRTP